VTPPLPRRMAHIQIRSTTVATPLFTFVIKRPRRKRQALHLFSASHTNGSQRTGLSHRILFQRTRFRPSPAQENPIVVRQSHPKTAGVHPIASGRARKAKKRVASASVLTSFGGVFSRRGLLD